MIYFIFGIVHNRLNLLLMSLMSVTFTLKLQYVFETVPNFRLSYIIFLREKRESVKLNNEIGEVVVGFYRFIENDLN